MNNFTITQASVMALITQIVSFVAGFGIINSTNTGVIIAAATALVNAAFLIANSFHHIANVVDATTVPAREILHK